MYAKVLEFSAVPDGKTLVVVMDTPNRTKVLIDSEDAWKEYGRGIPMKPMIVFDPPTFQIKFQDGNSVIWTAKLGTSTIDSDKLLYDLVRQTTN